MNYNKLIEVVKEHGGLEDQDLKDATNNGADGGFAGFTYYDDTVEFYDKNEEIIWELLESMADDIGTTPLKLVGDFNCADSITDMKTFKNALARFALEEAGRVLINREEAIHD